MNNSTSSSSSWYYNNSQQAEQLQQQSGSSRSSSRSSSSSSRSLGGARGGMEEAEGSRSGHYSTTSISRNKTLSMEDEEMGPTQEYYDSFRRDRQGVYQSTSRTTAAAIRIKDAVAEDLGQLPTDKDLTKSRVHKQRQLQKAEQRSRSSSWRERSIHKQTLRGRLRRMRSNKEKKQECLLASSFTSNEEQDDDADDDDDDAANIHHRDDDDNDDDDNHQNSSRGDDEETGRGGGDEDDEAAFPTTSTADDDDDDYSDSKQPRRDKNSSNEKGGFFGSLCSTYINPYKSVDTPPDPSCCRRYLSERVRHKQYLIICLFVCSPLSGAYSLIFFPMLYMSLSPRRTHVTTGT
jgi:hypothetical protein